jgi:hypothetical protein
LYADISDIYEEEAKLHSESIPHSDYTSTINYLAFCIAEINTNGYRKDWKATKREAHKAARNGIATAGLTAQAQEITDFFAEFETEDSFYRNIKSALAAKYSKVNGFVAYAPIAYQKALDTIRAKQARAAENAISQWQGTVGEKITASLELVRSYGYETDYGYQHIHLFKDSSGNIYKWSTGKCIGEKQSAQVTVSGTVKAHGEYEGVKQTVLTRCKVS